MKCLVLFSDGFIGSSISWMGHAMRSGFFHVGGVHVR